MKLYDWWISLNNEGRLAILFMLMMGVYSIGYMYLNRERGKND